MMTQMLLLLLCTFAYSSGKKYQIEWDQCAITTNCFVRNSCIENQISGDTLTLMKDGEKLKNGKCDVIIQTRHYLESKMHIMMQLQASGSSQTIANSGMLLTQGSFQFGCTKDGPTGNNDLFYIERKGDYSYEKTTVFCSFTLETKDIPAIEAKFYENKNNPILEFTIGPNSRQSLTFPRKKEYFWFPQSKHQCYPEMLTSKRNASDDILEEQVDTYSFAPISCDPPKSLIITRGNDTSVLSTGETMSCVGTSWNYKYNSTTIETDWDERINAVCGVKFCSLCTPFEYFNCTGCSVPTFGRTSENCSTTVCPGNHWILEDGSVVEGEMECRHETWVRDSRYAFFYINKSNKNVYKAACIRKSICWEQSKIDESCPPLMTCQMLERKEADSELSCSNGGMISHAFAGKVFEGTAQITCEFATSKFKDGNGNELAVGSNVYCDKNRKNFAAAALTSLSTLLIVLYYGIL